MLDFARNIVKVPSCLLQHTTVLPNISKILRGNTAIQNVIIFVWGTKNAKLLYFSLSSCAHIPGKSYNKWEADYITKANAIYPTVRIFNSWLRVCSVQCQNILPFKCTKCVCSGISAQIPDSVFLPRSCRSVAYDYLNQFVAAFRACLNYIPLFPLRQRIQTCFQVLKKNELLPFTRLYVNSHTGFSGSKARKSITL